MLSLLAYGFVVRPLPRGVPRSAVRMAEPSPDWDTPTIKVPDVSAAAANITEMLLEPIAKDEGFDFQDSSAMVQAWAKEKAPIVQAWAKEKALAVKEYAAEVDVEALVAKAKELKPDDVKAAALAAVERVKAVEWAELKDKVDWAEIKEAATAKIEAIKQSEAVKPIVAELEEKVAANMETINEALEPLMQKKAAFLEENEEQIAALKLKGSELYESSREKAAEAVLAAKAKIKEMKDEA